MYNDEGDRPCTPGATVDCNPVRMHVSTGNATRAAAPDALRVSRDDFSGQDRCHQRLRRVQNTRGSPVTS
eukprot:SAG22_NODE_48_length_24654_cov_4.406394_10_plen_70_part_00